MGNPLNFSFKTALRLNFRRAILFADDTTCFYSHKVVKTLCETVNSELKEVCNWFKANKSSPNAKKKKKKKKDKYVSGNTFTNQKYGW